MARSILPTNKERKETMAAGKALDGKPYAGNPHVRFDEVKVAPAATPRRGSLLYKKLIVLLVLAGTASSFGAPVFDNGVLTYTVAADATETEANTFASYGTVTSVVKEGAGTLKLTVSNSSYGGTVDIKAGILDCAHGHALGSKNGTVYVRDGAQLKPTFSTTQGDSYISPSVHIIGEGPDGNGAIRAANSGMGD